MVESKVAAGDKINIVIVEDEGLYRDLLRVALSQHPNLEVVGAFGGSEEALEQIPPPLS